jgi:RNA recognition motif-containing protein
MKRELMIRQFPLELLTAHDTEEVRMKLFVGNFSFDVTEGDLQKAFEPFGRVSSVAVMRQRHSDDSRGCGFLEMPYKREAQAEIGALDGKEWMGRTLNVSEARPRPQFRQEGLNKGGGRGHDSRRRGGKRHGGNRRAGRGF